MKNLLVTFMLGLLLPVAASGALKPNELADRAAVIEYMAHTGDIGYLAEISEVLSGEKARGDAQKFVHYYAALAAYRAAELDDDVEFRMGVLLDRCIDQGKKAAKLDREFADALALIGACHGLAASRQPLSAIIAGNFAARELKKALAIAPENPRVLLLNAVTLLRRFDDPDRLEIARTQLVHAIEAYDSFADLYRPNQPGWGEEQAHFWLADVSERLGDRVAARDHLEQALLIAPQMRVAQNRFANLGR